MHAALPDLRSAAQLGRAAEVQQEQLHCHRGGWRQGDSSAPHRHQQQPGACREGRRHARHASLSCSRHTRQHQLPSTCQVLANGPQELACEHMHTVPHSPQPARLGGTVQQQGRQGLHL